MKTPKLSVIIPCYNQGSFLLEALSGVSDQADIEVIIVNDGSTDPETIEVFKRLDRSKYVVIEQENKGLCITRNIAIQRAKAEYILALDADNIVLPDYYRKAIQILDAQPRTGVVYCNREMFGLKTDKLHVGVFNLGKLLHGNYIDTCAIFRKIAWEQVGGYDENMFGYEDWELWISVYKKGWNFHHLDEFLFKYRVRENSLVTICAIPENRKKLMTYIYQKHKDLYEQHLYDITYYTCTLLEDVHARLEDKSKDFEKLKEEHTLLHSKTENMRLKNRLKRLIGIK